MYLFLRISLLLAACHGGVQLTHSHLNFDQLCHLTRPVFRMTLLKDVMDQLQQKYNIHSGYAVFETCDPRDPDINPDCFNYNNPSVAYGSTLVPCPHNQCPPETPASSVLPDKSGFYQPKQDHALVLFGCLPPNDYFGIQTYLYEKATSNIQEGLSCSDAISSPTGDNIDVFPPNPSVPETRVVVDSP